jgi:hypothetical protein
MRFIQVVRLGIPPLMQVLKPLAAWLAPVPRASNDRVKSPLRLRAGPMLE